MLSNSNNHKNDGQNVLYADGHVEYQKTPWCGSYETTTGNVGIRDDIYVSDIGGVIASTGSSANTFGSASIGGQPDTALDSALLPWDDMEGQ